MTSIHFSNGLVAQDDNLDQLYALFEQLQLATVDAGDPGLDLLTFAQRTALFSVILKQRRQDVGNTSLPNGCNRSPRAACKELRSPRDPISRPLDKGDPLKTEAIGLLYLTLPSNPNQGLHANELNLGIIIEPKHQGFGYAQRSVEYALQVAFEQLQCHRVQVILPDHIYKNRAICFFTGMRFVHEGIRRLAYYSPFEKEYKNVTYMAILDIDWVRNQMACLQPAPHSVWDELFTRHDYEREELRRWEDKFSPCSRSETSDSDTISSPSTSTAFSDAFVKTENLALEGVLRYSADTKGVTRGKPFCDSDSDRSAITSTRSQSPTTSDGASSSWDILDSPRSVSLSIDDDPFSDFSQS